MRLLHCVYRAEAGIATTERVLKRIVQHRYRVIFVAFVNGIPYGEPLDVLTGFLSPDGQARGRPVGLTLDGHGGLLVADDVGNTIWRVQAVAP
jgi:glucose/arabinose dehydrogenase